MLSVADTEGARLWAFDVEAPGVLRAPEPFRPHSGHVIAGLPGNARFDSVAVMASRSIAVAPLTTGSMTEFSPAGDVVREVKMPDVYLTNMCFGGPDMRTAYITLSDTGRLGMMQWPEPGLKLHFGSCWHLDKDSACQGMCTTPFATPALHYRSQVR
jgi:gluconolactonase